MHILFKALWSATFFLASVCSLSSTSVYGQFDLLFDIDPSFSPSQVAVFDQVESAIESQILDYKPGVTLSGAVVDVNLIGCLLYTSPSPRDRQKSRMPSSA